MGRCCSWPLCCYGMLLACTHGRLHTPLRTHCAGASCMQTASPRSSTSSICRSICRPAASTARPAPIKLHACSRAVPGLLHHQHQGDSSRRHQRSTAAAAAAATQDASASDDPHQQQQHQQGPPAAAADDGQQAQQHLDELIADDNIILLLGSEDEEEAEEDLKAGQESEDGQDEEGGSGGVRVPEDFAAAMAAARQQLLSSSSGSSSEDDWDGGGEPWDSTYSDSEVSGCGAASEWVRLAEDEESEGSPCYLSWPVRSAFSLPHVAGCTRLSCDDSSLLHLHLLLFLLLAGLLVD